MFIRYPQNNSTKYKFEEELVVGIREKVRKDAALRKNTAPDNEPDGVELMTFHRSKGLEFDTVYIIDASEGFTPQSRAETAEEIEEERRAFYVAATRARDELYICDNSCQPCSFLHPKELQLISIHLPDL